MDDLRERVEAVERALTDGDGDLTALADGAARAERVEALENDVASLQEDVAELEAATQAIRGYVGNVRSANESVEQRADSAVAAVGSLEERVDDLEDRTAVPGTDPARTTTPREDSTSRPADVGMVDHEPAERGRDEREPVSGGTVGSEPSGDPDARTAACQVCGRGGNAEAATDGGGRTETHAARPSAASERPDPGSSSAGVDSTGRSIGGVDPTDGSHRVRIDQTDDGLGSSRRDTGSLHDRTATDEPSPGLLDRVRELV